MFKFFSEPNTTDKTVDLYVYRRFRLICTLEQSAKVYNEREEFRKVLPPSQHEFYKFIITDVLHRKLHIPTEGKV
jgi:hypothetical protein